MRILELFNFIIILGLNTNVEKTLSVGIEQLIFPKQAVPNHVPEAHPLDKKDKEIPPADGAQTLNPPGLPPKEIQGVNMLPGGYSDDDDDYDDFAYHSSYDIPSSSVPMQVNKNSTKHVSKDWMKGVLSKEDEIRAPRNSTTENDRWKQEVQTLWHTAQRNRGAITRTLQNAFHAVTNPYDLALYLVEKSRDFTQGIIIWYISIFRLNT